MKSLVYKVINMCQYYVICRCRKVHLSLRVISLIGTKSDFQNITKENNDNCFIDCMFDYINK